MRIQKSKLFSAVSALLLVSQLSGCFPVVAGGAVAGGAMAADRRTSGIYIEDQNIEIKAAKSISDHLGDKIHVNVTSYNRNVLLTGEATDDASKAKAEAIAKEVANVKSVVNELAVAGISSISARSSDTYITSKVKTNMITENRFPPNYVKVITENSVVYLMGLVKHQESDAAVEVARSTSGVAKVVKVFEYID
jgi:osmotically-inducible protein OsmY